MLAAAIDVSHGLADAGHHDGPRRRHRLRAVPHHPASPAGHGRRSTRQRRPRAASPRAAGPSLVAALTVIIALLGLYASGLYFIGKLGLAACITVAVAALGALTVVPALLALMPARRIDRLQRAPAGRRGVRRARGLARATPSGSARGRGAYLLAGVALLGILAIPAFSHAARSHRRRRRSALAPRPRLPTTSSARASGRARTARSRSSSQLGHGSADRAGAAAAASCCTPTLAKTPDVATVSPVKATPDGALLYAHGAAHDRTRSRRPPTS